MIRYTKVPHSMRLLLTGKCNLQCSFCLINAAHKDKKQAGKEELETAEWLTFFERLKELRVFNITLSGGEIFLRNDLFILLKKLRGSLMHRIMLLTNGTLITNAIALQLSRLKMKYISISLDGLEEKHDRLRGQGSFQETVRGIQRLLEAGIIPQVSFTPMRSNYKELGPLIDFLAPLGLKTIRVNTLTPEGRCLHIYQDIVPGYPHQVKEILTVVEEKKQTYPGLMINCELGFYYYLPHSYELHVQNNAANPEKYKVKHLKDGCGAASTSCTVTPAGDVIPCEGFAAFAGGNIRERDLLDIWNESENFKTIRELSGIAMDRVPFCKDCKYNFLCDGGCRAATYLLHNDLLAPDILCPFWERNGLTGG